MSTQHLFMFSSGTYSDYGVDGVFVCDHAVTKEQWAAHYAAYQAECSERSLSHSGKTWDEFYDCGDYKRLEVWKVENDPEKTFQALHGMVRLKILELWRDA